MTKDQSQLWEEAYIYEFGLPWPVTGSSSPDDIDKLELYKRHIAFIRSVETKTIERCLARLKEELIVENYRSDEWIMGLNQAIQALKELLSPKK